MTREEFAAQCERGAQYTSALPVTSAVLRWTCEQLRKGEPAWWKPVAKAWEKRRFVAWSEAWALYLACLHFEALNDADCPLVPYFPSCGGTAEADPSVALARFMQAPPPSFYENLRTRHRRPHVISRSKLWLSPALLYFQRARRLPYYLVEVGAGAGLGLAADMLATEKVFRSDLVEARVGLDEGPLMVEDIAHRRWMTACLYPDAPAQIAALDTAMEKVAAAIKDDASYIQLAPCTIEKSPAFIAKNIPVEPDIGLLVFNTGVTGRMLDEEYAAYSKAMAQMLAPWGDRGVWAEIETVRGEVYSTTVQLRAHRVIDGQLRSLVMMNVDEGAGKSVYFEASKDFLSVARRK